MKHGCFGALLLVALLIGCSKNESPAPEVAQRARDRQAESTSKTSSPAADPQTATAESAVLPPLNAVPHEIVENFLAALRAGHKDTVAALLTRTAREETAKHDLVVEPPGTPAAKFTVGKTELVEMEGTTGAYVESTWTEPDGAGSQHQYQITWVLRRQENGWRIAGMATEVVPGEAPWLLNFEDPADMLRKQQEAAETFAGRQQPPVQQAQNPRDSSGVVR